MNMTRSRKVPEVILISEIKNQVIDHGHVKPTQLIYVRISIDVALTSETSFAVRGIRTRGLAGAEQLGDILENIKDESFDALERYTIDTKRIDSKPYTHLDIDVTEPSIVCYHSTISNLKFYKDAVRFGPEGESQPPHEEVHYPDDKRWVTEDGSMLLFFAHEIKNNEQKKIKHKFDLDMAWIGARHDSSGEHTTPIIFDPTIPNGSGSTGPEWPP